jgi:hypothetical protein
MILRPRTHAGFSFVRQPVVSFFDWPRFPDRWPGKRNIPGFATRNNLTLFFWEPESRPERWLFSAMNKPYMEQHNDRI